MIEIYLRRYYQTYFVDPIARNLMAFDPIFVTGIGLVLGSLAGFFIAIKWMGTAFIFMLLSGFMDTLDGTLARMKVCSSPFGCVLDIISDRLVEFAIIFGLYLAYGGVFPLLMLGSVMICVTSFLVVGIFSENKSQKSFHYSPGLMERPEAFLFFSLMLFLPEYFQIISFLFCLLVFLTAFMRVIQFKNFQKD